MAKGIPQRGEDPPRRQLTSARRLAQRPVSALVIAGSAVAVLAATTVPATAGAARSSNPAPTVLQSPPARYEASMDYDAATGNIVLFGGEKYGAVLGDTWTFNGSTWTQLSPSASPPARGAAMMAYDPATSNMVLFGGQSDNGYLTGTWIWNGTTWTELSPSPSPFPVFVAMMAYDPPASDVVMFGGNATTHLIRQTWTWDGSTWTQLSPPKHPSAREQTVMAYDPGTSQIVLYGGAGLVAGHATCLHGTWTWTGTTWTRLTPATHPSACFGSAMAYDQATGQLVLFGGATILKSGAVKILDQTWTWNGTTWTRQSPAAHPSARYGAAMAYDQATGQLVLFGGAIRGGKVTYGDTWTWNGTTWTRLSP
jgi:hypothetical protein